MTYDAILMIIIGAVIAGIIGFGFDKIKKQIAKNEDKREARAAEAEAARNKTTMLMIEHLSGVGKLSYATAIALKEKKCNGVMENALEYYVEIDTKMGQFITEKAVKNINQ